MQKKIKGGNIGGCNLYFKNCMHKAGKVIFRITNGSAFFVLKTFTPNVNGFIWTLRAVMLQDET